MAFVPFVETDQPTMAAFNEKFQQNYEAILAESVKFVFGSYAGTGATSKTLSFEFEPKLLIVRGPDEFYNYLYEYMLVALRGMTFAKTYAAYTANATYGLGASLSWDENTVTIGNDTQLNSANQTYYYAAFG